MYPEPSFYKHKELQRQQSRLTKKPSHPEIETRSNSAYKSVCWLWHLDISLFTFNPAWGHPARNTVIRRKLEIAVMENVRQVRFKRRQKLLGKNLNGRGPASTVRRLNGASEKKSQCEAVLSVCPVVLEGFAGLLSKGEPHCSLWIHYNVHYDSQSVVTTSE